MGWLFVPESAGWNSDSTSPSETPTGAPLLWRGKPMLLRSWLRAWKTAPWTRLLSGTTLPPSTADRGVESWISSLAATRVSHSHSPASVLERMTRDTSGRTSNESCERLSQLSLFSRTSPAIYRSDSMRSARAFRAWAIGLRREYSARRKSAPRTDASGCSCWPTSQAYDSGNSHAPRLKKDRDPNMPGSYRGDLKDVVVNWPTATTMDTMDAARQGIVGNHNLSLPVAASGWATPNAHDGRRPGSDATSTQGANLKRDGEAWTTPQAHDVTMRGSGQVPCSEAGNACLARDATSWATPTSRDHKDGTDPSANVPTNCLLGRQAPRATGPASQQNSGPRRLNPAFVEWLMGLPQGWTDFAPVETEWSRWLRLMRSELSRLNS